MKLESEPDIPDPAVHNPKNLDIERAIAAGRPINIQLVRAGSETVNPSRAIPRQPVTPPHTPVAQPPAPPPVIPRSQSTLPAQSAKPKRHGRKCSVCRHPYRDLIDSEFIRWNAPADICKAYQIGEVAYLYRHAHATGLFDHRRKNVRFVLENIIERSSHVRVTAHSVVRAVHVYARLNNSGRLVERHTSRTRLKSSSDAKPSRRHGRKLNTRASHSKSKKSNRKSSY